MVARRRSFGARPPARTAPKAPRAPRLAQTPPTPEPGGERLSDLPTPRDYAGVIASMPSARLATTGPSSTFAT